MDLKNKIRVWVLDYAGSLRVDDIEIYMTMARRFEETESLEKEKSLKEISEDPELSEREIYEYRGHIDEIYDSIGGAVDIAYSMAMVALHSRVEIARKKIVTCIFSDVDEKKLGYIKYVKKEIYPRLPEIKESAAVTELRLINNAIKHTECKVSEELGMLEHYEKGQFLSNMDTTYRKLLPDVSEYIKELSNAAKKQII